MAKVLYHHRTLSEDGQAVHIRSMVSAFRADGHEVKEEALVPKCPGHSPACGPRLSSGWKAIASLPACSLELAEYAYNALAISRIARAAIKFKPDFIYERYAFGNASGGIVSRRLKVPLVLEVNSPLALELQQTRGLKFPRMARRFELSIFRRAAIVCVVTRVLKEMLIEMGVSPSRLLVTPNGVNPENYGASNRESARLALGLPADCGPVLGAIGYFRDWHRLETVINLLALPPLQKTHLVLIGSGPAERHLRQTASEARVDDRVHFVGTRPHTDIPHLLSAIDIGVLAAVNSYASPLKLHEYMAAGVAIVAPLQPNMTEILKDGKDALLVRPGDQTALARAIVTLVNHPKLRATLGGHAQEAVEARNLTWLNNARRVVSAVSATHNLRLL